MKESVPPNRPTLIELCYGVVWGTVVVMGIFIALQNMTYTPKGKVSNKSYFVYQGY